jgi:hypothetical protein
LVDTGEPTTKLADLIGKVSNIRFPATATMAPRRHRSVAALLLVAAVSAAVITSPKAAPNQRLQDLFGKAAAPKQRLQDLFGKAADDVLVCPADGSALRAEVSIYGSTRRESRVSESGMRYPVNRDYVDLLASSGKKAEGGGITPAQFADELRDAFATRTQTQMFRSPVLGFLYERGWRQNFNNAGFPGIEKEFAEASDFFSPVASGGVVVDMSCGSGLMYRRLLKSREYGRVIACDYSEVMLKETRRRAIEEGLPRADLELCRCDVAQLPMRDGSVDAMHAGDCRPDLAPSCIRAFKRTRAPECCIPMAEATRTSTRCT